MGLEDAVSDGVAVPEGEAEAVAVWVAEGVSVAVPVAAGQHNTVGHLQSL